MSVKWYENRKKSIYSEYIKFLLIKKEFLEFKPESNVENKLKDPKMRLKTLNTKFNIKYDGLLLAW